MARMRVTSINRWGNDGIQVNFELVPPADGIQVTYTKMALPTNAEEFDHLMNIRLYDEFDVEAEKVTPL
jgi:hypothetical protein